MYIILFVFLAIFVLIPEAINKWLDRKEIEHLDDHLKEVSKTMKGLMNQNDYDKRQK